MKVLNEVSSGQRHYAKPLRSCAICFDTNEVTRKMASGMLIEDKDRLEMLLSWESWSREGERRTLWLAILRQIYQSTILLNIYLLFFIAIILGRTLTSKLAPWCLRTSPLLLTICSLQFVVECLSCPIDSSSSLGTGVWKRNCLSVSAQYSRHLAHSQYSLTVN